MDQVEIVKDNLQKISLGPFLNILSHTWVSVIIFGTVSLTLSWRGPLSYRNQYIDLQSKANQWAGFYMITAFVMKELTFLDVVGEKW